MTIDAPAPPTARYGRRRVYVYYRVAAPQAESAVATALALQSRLCARHGGLRAELMRRPQAAEGQVTLMETYARDAAVDIDGIDAALMRDIDAEASRAFAHLALGARHVEVFDACA